jgi:hypothetical protein
MDHKVQLKGTQREEVKVNYFLNSPRIRLFPLALLRQSGCEKVRGEIRMGVVKERSNLFQK